MAHFSNKNVIALSIVHRNATVPEIGHNERISAFSNLKTLIMHRSYFVCWNENSMSLIECPLNKRTNGIENAA